MTETPVPIALRSLRVSKGVGLFASGVGAVVLVGWAFNINALTSVIPDGATMKPATASGFVLLGAALWLHAAVALGTQRSTRVAVAGALAALAAALGVATLFEYGLSVNVGVDTWLFADAVRNTLDRHPGRMAQVTALAVALLGSSIALRSLSAARARQASQLFALTAAGLGMLGLAGYFYDVRALYRFAGYASVSLPTAMLIFIVGAGVLLLESRRGIVAPVVSRRSGGVMARRLLPAVLILPFALGWLTLQGELAGLYATAFGLALFACANVMVFAPLTWWSARLLNRLDARREASDTAARDALGESERRYRALAESLPQLVWTFAPDGSCDYVSPQWATYTGLPPSAQLGARWVDQLLPSDLPAVIAQWKWSIKSGEAFDAEFRIQRADGVYRWFRSMAAPVRDSGARIVKWFGTNTDVDDRKRAEAELQNFTAVLELRVRERTQELEIAKNKAESADRLKTDFIMSMSHELRTPLNAIIGFTGTLLMRLPGPLTGEQDQQLRIVQASGRQLLLIINDVLDVARIEAGSLTLTLEAVDVCAVVRTVVAELAPAAQDKQLTLVAELPGDPVILHSDPRALHQILVNLTSNAVKFTQHGGVTVSLRDAAIRGGRGVELVVADTGVGIAASDFSRLFTKFGQLGTAGSTSPGGTGLGLYLSRTLVERLSGRIRVESQPSRGSRFVVTFGGRP